MRAAGFLKRVAAIAVGVLLGALVVAGSDPLRGLLRKSDPAPSAPIQRERAPDLRV